MSLDGFLAAAEGDLGRPLAKLCDELFHPRPSALVFFRRLDVGLENCHASSLSRGRRVQVSGGFSTQLGLIDLSVNKCSKFPFGFRRNSCLKPTEIRYLIRATEAQ